MDPSNDTIYAYKKSTSSFKHISQNKKEEHIYISKLGLAKSGFEFPFSYPDPHL